MSWCILYGEKGALGVIPQKILNFVDLISCIMVQFEDGRPAEIEQSVLTFRCETYSIYSSTSSENMWITKYHDCDQHIDLQ